MSHVQCVMPNTILIETQNANTQSKKEERLKHLIINGTQGNKWDNGK